MTSHVDWPRLLGDLQYVLGEIQAGNPDLRVPVGTPMLAKSLNLSRSTVRNWIEGAEPKHSDGEQLIRTWCRLTGKTSEHVPLTRPALSAAGLKAP